MLATWDSDQHTLREIHRFTNCLQKVDGFDCWDIDAWKARSVRAGESLRQGILIDSIGIDTWGVDYVLLDSSGAARRPAGLLSRQPHPGPDGARQAQLGKAEIYAAAAFSFCRLTPFISCARWLSSSRSWSAGCPCAADPGLFQLRLTGNMNWEYTNATTTQLVNINSDSWDETC
jgi:rhamnulokinase